MPPGSLFLLVAALPAAALGHLGAIAVQGLAARGQMLDRPGAHRLHASPTPRGGGIGVAAALLAIGLAPNFLIPQAGDWQLSAVLLALAVSVVAIVGWIDDHRGLSVWLRLLIHLLAASLVALGWWVGAWSPSLGVAALVLLATAASVNLHNFFDGADGLLSSQSLFVLVVLGSLTWRIGHMPLALISLAGAAALAAFLPHNAPPARVFLGDVGSGVLGLAIAAVGTFAVRDGALSLPALLILVSGCLIDTGMTLASRLLRGRRFWRRHREHLYQWLIRTGWSHRRVLATWFIWNVLVVLPSLLLMPTEPTRSWFLAAIVYAFGMSIWILSKRHLWRRARNAP